MILTSVYRRHRRGLAVLIACLATILAASARAAGPAPAPTVAAPFTVQARVGFDGYYKVGGWLPVFAIARNEGAPVEGTIALGATGTDAALGQYGAVASLPTHSQKELYFAAPVAASDQSRAITLSQNGQTLFAERAPLSPLSPQAYLYGLVSPDAGALDALRGQRLFGGSVAVAHLTLADIPPSSPALNDLDALVLDDVATSALSAAQRDAILAWVSSGGQLILGGGAGAAQTVAGLATIAPVTVGGVSTADVGSAFAEWTGQNATDMAVVAQATPVAGAVVQLRVGGAPLVVARRLGDGWVTFLAVAPNAASLDGSPGVRAWGHILSGDRHPLNGPPVGDQPAGNAVSSTVYALPQAALPSDGDLALLIFGYIFVVGPVSYLILRRLDRRELLWLSIPIVSVVFTAAAYALAGQIKGSALLLNSVAVVRDDATVDGVRSQSVAGAVGVFSPGRASYDVAVGAGLAATPLATNYGATPDAPLNAVTDDTSTDVRGLHVEKWSMRAFAVYGNAVTDASRLPAPVASALSVSGSTVTGWVRNVSGGQLLNVTVVVGTASASFPTLAPGEQRDVRIVLGGAGTSSGVPVRTFVTAGATLTAEERTRETMLNAEINGLGGDQAVVSGPTIYSFSTDTPLAPTVIGYRAARQALTLHVMPATIALAAAPKALPYGLARRTLLENTGAATSFSGAVLPLGSTATFQFALPANTIGVQWTALHLRMGLARGGSAGLAATVTLYNWAAGAWETQPNVGSGDSLIGNATRYVDPRGLVRVQITGSNGQLVLQRLDIALDAAQ